MGTLKKWGRGFKCNLVIPSQLKKITRNSIPIDQGDREKRGTLLKKKEGRC